MPDKVFLRNPIKFIWEINQIIFLGNNNDKCVYCGLREVNLGLLLFIKSRVMTKGHKH